MIGFKFPFPLGTFPNGKSVTFENLSLKLKFTAKKEIVGFYI